MSADQNRVLLGERVTQACHELQRRDGMIAFPHHWQVPAATEKRAFEALAAHSEPLEFEYLGLPWATLIDGLRNNASPTWELLRILNGISADVTVASDTGQTGQPRRATVAQHIHADQYIEFFQACGVTDLFWSHATVDRPEIGGIAVHPFPLFPAQTPDGPPPGMDLHRPRPYLANFIGAYNPRVYLTDVRAHIFDDADTAEDLLIIKREAWHFNRVVYSEQMKGITPDEARLALEEQHRTEYLEAIRDSAFTLCPTGSGPNSIRIGEALALASIPIILTRDLALPGDRDLWEAACLFAEDSAEGYRQALATARAMTAGELRSRQKATQSLFKMTGPDGWCQLLCDRMSENTLL